MNCRKILAAVVVCGSLTLSAFAADTVVTLSDVHMCCGNCVKGVETALKDVAGAKGVGSQAESSIKITASDPAVAQKAVNALIAAGYYGKSSDTSIKVENATGARDTKVQTLGVSGVHLCCGKCVTAVKEVLSKIDGVTGNTVVQNAPTFNVTGDFNQKAVFDALNKAGLAGHVGTPTTAPSAK